MHHPTDRIAHTTAFVTPVVEHWLEVEIAKYKTANMCKTCLIFMFNFCTYANHVNIKHTKWLGSLGFLMLID